MKESELVQLLPSDEEAWPPGSESDSFWGIKRRTHTWRPPTDVFETDDAYHVRVEIAGMRGADFAVTFDKQTLVIRGMRSDEGTQKAYHQMEIAYGEFETAVQVSEPVNVPEIEASYVDGFLRVKLPKAQPKVISIE
ncbi:MAG: Hsp20 family protein [Candidatus Latescibacteria bacterium]|nr:Hsp20 family protein [Candidatus Latescibacterota bacterium]NIO78687.1 Hsp20 family protein [Candidatus Latescibacterota bacterium]